MIKHKKDLKAIYDYAYIPEHIYTYVEAISDVETHFSEHYLYYQKDDTLIFIGYPIQESFNHKKTKKIIEDLIRTIDCNFFTVILPIGRIEGLNLRCISQDTYYRLVLDDVAIKQKVRNMLNRASKEIYVERSKSFEDEHRLLVEDFIVEKDLDDSMKEIFKNMDRYLKRSDTALVINARDKAGRLVGFNIVDNFSKDYLFYMFNIRSGKNYVSGASDLMFHEMIKLAEENEKRYINLGLGINKGVSFFKEQWGGRPFMKYYLLEGKLETKPKIFSIIDKLL